MKKFINITIIIVLTSLLSYMTYHYIYTKHQLLFQSAMEDGGYDYSDWNCEYIWQITSIRYIPDCYLPFAKTTAVRPIPYWLKLNNYNVMFVWYVREGFNSHNARLLAGYDVNLLPRTGAEYEEYLNLGN